eukprot:gene2732-3927_t
MGNDNKEELQEFSFKTESESLQKVLKRISKTTERSFQELKPIQNWKQKVSDISELLPHLSVLEIVENLKLNKGDKALTLDILLNNKNGQKDYIISQTKDNLVYEENEFIRQHLLYLQLMKECGLEDIASPSKGLDEEEVMKFDSLELEKYMIEKKRCEAKSAANVHFYMDGEKDVLNGDMTKIKFYTITPRNSFNLDAEDIHFRICESQFTRWSIVNGQGYAQYSISEVKYVVNPMLFKTFQNAKEKLAKRHGFLLESMKPLLLFHGTSPKNMENIIKTNFLISKVGSTTDMGYYGKGVYFSEYPGTSISYSHGNPYLFLCLVYVGKAYKMQNVVTGCSLTKGYDSHISPCGSEVVIFDTDCILPCYKVKYTTQNQVYHDDYDGEDDYY